MHARLRGREAGQDRRDPPVGQGGHDRQRAARPDEERPDPERSLDTFYEKAFNLMTSAKAKEAFAIDRETPAASNRTASPTARFS